MRILNVLAHTLFFDESHHLKRKGKGLEREIKNHRPDVTVTKRIGNHPHVYSLFFQGSSIPPQVKNAVHDTLRNVFTHLMSNRKSVLVLPQSEGGLPKVFRTLFYKLISLKITIF